MGQVTLGMGRWRSRLLRFVAIGAVLVVGMIGPVDRSWAQEETPAAGRDVPGPEECRVEPRSLASLVGLATPGAGVAAATLPVGTPGAVPAGEPLDEATLAAVGAAARELVACRNAGETLRSLALYSDGFLRRFFATPGSFTPSAYGALATPTPVAPEQRVALAAVRDGRRLADGRVGATVVVDDPAAIGGETLAASFVVFVERDGRWLVDDAIAVAVDGRATPAA